MSSISIATGSPRAAGRPATRRSATRRPAAGRPAAHGPATRSARPAVRPAAVRLTARGRLVAFVLLALALTALVVLRAPASAAPSGGPAVADRVTVHPGETLWQIARRAVPDADPRSTVARIQDMNGLSASIVQPGRVLLVPARR